MTKHLIFLTMMLGVVSCDQYKPSRKLVVHASYGAGWELTSTSIVCDSATMTGRNSAVLWIDGQRSEVFAERVTISSIEHY